MPTNFKAFLRVEENKTALFTFLADQLALVETEGKVLISKKEENVVSKLAIPDPSDMLQPCTHKRADYRLMLHLRHCVETGHTKITLTAGDSDVAVLAIFAAASMKEEPSFHLLEEVWIEFIVMKKNVTFPYMKLSTL